MMWKKKSAPTYQPSIIPVRIPVEQIVSELVPHFNDRSSYQASVLSGVSKSFTSKTGTHISSYPTFAHIATLGEAVFHATQTINQNGTRIHRDNIRYSGENYTTLLTSIDPVCETHYRVRNLVRYHKEMVTALEALVQGFEGFRTLVNEPITHNLALRLRSIGEHHVKELTPILTTYRNQLDRIIQFEKQVGEDLKRLHDQKIYARQEELRIEKVKKETVCIEKVTSLDSLSIADYLEVLHVKLESVPELEAHYSRSKFHEIHTMLAAIHKDDSLIPVHVDVPMDDAHELESLVFSYDKRIKKLQKQKSLGEERKQMLILALEDQLELKLAKLQQEMNT